MLRMLLAGLAALVLVLGAGACSDGDDSGTSPGASTASAEGEPPAEPTGTLRVAISGQPQTLDPTKTVSAFDLPIMTALYDGLVTRKPDSFNQVSPALAASWISNQDATEWTFKLRRGVKFSDGSTFDAAAAKKSLEFSIREGAIFSFAVGPVSKIETPDDSTVVLTYGKPYPDLLSYLPIVQMISPKLLSGSTKAVDRRVATSAVGTGPYILDSFSSSGGVVAHANPDYWGEGPHIQNLEFRPILEESARNAALQAGEVDLVSGISPRTVQSFSSDPRLKVSTVPSWTTEVLSLPTQMTPLDDVRVRRALAHAIDPEAIAKSVLLGQATVTGALQPPDTYGFQRPATQYPYDPTKAKALLEEAGVEQPVKLTMVTAGSDAIGGPVGQALAEQAKAAGFEIKFTRVADAARLEDLFKPQRKYQIHLMPNGWIDGGPLQLAAGYVTGRANYEGQRLADLIEQMNTTPNGPKREQIIADALEEAARELPEIPLFALKVSDASTSALQNHVPAQDGYLPTWSEQYLFEG